MVAYDERELLDEWEAGELAVELDDQEPQEVLRWGMERFGPRLAICTSLQSDGMALLDIAPDQAATAEEVIARYGVDNELALPTTRQPEDSPVYLVYRFPWGKLSFGFEPDLDGRLTNVVVDAIPER